MAGSKKWFVYTTDDGQTNGILADESNVEAVNGAAAAAPTAASAPTRQVPRGTKLRTATYGDTSGNRRITIPILNATIFASIEAGIRTIPDPLPGSTGTLTFIRKNPERRQIPRFGIDTGLTDGDN